MTFSWDRLIVAILFAYCLGLLIGYSLCRAAHDADERVKGMK